MKHLDYQPMMLQCSRTYTTIILVLYKEDPFTILPYCFNGVKEPKNALHVC